MNIANEIKVEILGISKNEALARSIVASFVSQLTLTIEELSDIKTAVSEAVTNSIVHGYSQSVGFVTIECRLYEGEGREAIEIAIIDSGKGIADIEKAREPLYTTQPELERSGMGFTVMETFMDEVAISSHLGRGTKVTLRKQLTNNNEQ